MENWKFINANYEVSDKGNIKSVNYRGTGKSAIRKQSISKNGYMRVILSDNGKNKTYFVHRLVAAAFIPNPDNKPCIDHIDGDRANNHADNLRWVTVKENQNNPITKSKWIGKKAKPHHEKAVEQIKNGIVVNVFVSIQEAARKGNFSATAICKVCKGKGNLHKGYKWRYKK